MLASFISLVFVDPNTMFSKVTLQIKCLTTSITHMVSNLIVYFFDLKYKQFLRFCFYTDQDQPDVTYVLFQFRILRIRVWALLTRKVSNFIVNLFDMFCNVGGLKETLSTLVTDMISCFVVYHLNMSL